MELVKQLLMWFGAGCLVLYVFLALYFFVCWVVDKFTNRVVRAISNNPELVGPQGAKGDKGDDGLPRVDESDNHYIMMVVNGSWQMVNLEVFIESYLKILKDKEE